MNLTRVEREDLEYIVCDMLKELKFHGIQLYDKYKDLIDEILYDISDEEAISIVHSFKPSGETFSMGKVKEILSKTGKSSEEDCIEYYLTMNMMYNDYKSYVESKRLDIQDFCYEMSKLFINDMDAPKHKVCKYFKMYLDEDELED